MEMKFEYDHLTYDVMETTVHHYRDQDNYPTLRIVETKVMSFSEDEHRKEYVRLMLRENIRKEIDDSHDWNELCFSGYSATYHGDEKCSVARDPMYDFEDELRDYKRSLQTEE